MKIVGDCDQKQASLKHENSTPAAHSSRGYQNQQPLTSAAAMLHCPE
jgi:hypothetical protein